MTDQLRLELLEGDAEGVLIKSQGVTATVYGPELWDDQAAVLALMREDNQNAEVQKAEGELDAFGTLHLQIKGLVAGCQPQKQVHLTTEMVMNRLEEFGLSSLPYVRGLEAPRQLQASYT